MSWKKHNQLLPTRTAARFAWLERLSHGPAIRDKTRVGFECMRLGWTDWKKPRELIDLWAREVLTDEGRRVLAQWQAEDLARERSTELEST